MNRARGRVIWTKLRYAARGHVLRALRRPFRTLPSRIIVSVFAAALATSLVVAWFSTQSIESFLREKIDQKFPAILRSAVVRLDLWYSQRELDIETFARGAPVVDNLPHLGAGGGKAPRAVRAAEEIHQYLSYVLEQFPQYQSLMLLDLEGNEKLWIGPDAPLPPDLLRRLRTTTASQVSDVYGLERRRVQVASAPVRDSRSADLGSLHAVVRVGELERVLHSDDLSDSAGVYVVGREGEILLRSPEAPPRDRYDGPLPSQGESPVVEEYRDAAGEHVIGGATRFARFGWMVVVEEPYANAFAPVVTLIRKILAINLGIVAICCLIAYGIARSIVRPILALSDGAMRIATGETDVAIPDTAREDELGVLTRAFNEMTSRLQQNQGELEGQRLAIEDANRRLVSQNQELQRVSEVFEQLSITDGLTKLHNHRFFQEHLPLEMKRADRTGEALALILIDIDDFKALNDRLGHAVGDVVLKRVADVMGDEVREMDLLARYGGEEFALLASQTDLAGARSLAEKIRLAVSLARYPVSEEKKAERVSITVSIGVAAYKGDAKAFFNDADRALYRAKDAGKDCVVVTGD